ncbi:MAG: WD40 repeat domain-containing protein, partial [Longimicrobiales bacterium]
MTVWDVETGNALKSWPLADFAGDLRLSPSGELLATVSGRMITVWNVESGQQLHHNAFAPEGYLSGATPAFSSDGQWLAVAAYGDRVLEVMDARTANVVSSLGGHQVGVRALAFSPDSRWLATAEGNWGKPEIRLWELPAGTVGKSLVASGVNYVIKALAFTDQGRTLLVHSEDARDAVVGLYGRQWITALETESGRELRKEAVRGEFRAFTADNGYATANGGALAIWRTAAPAVTASVSASGTNVPVAAASPSQPVCKITESTADVRPEIVVQTGFRTSQGRTSVGDMALSPDGCWLATSDSSQPVTIWEVATGRRWRTLETSASQLKFSPDGRWLAGSSGGV